MPKRLPQISYRNVGDMAVAVQRSLHSFPADIDIVVGIPRSGLLAANLFALYRGVPLTDVDGLLQERLFESGSRLDLNNSGEIFKNARRILVLDDSVFSGSALNTVKTRIASSPLAARVVYGAVFIVPKAAPLVDFYCEIVHPPRVFSWNMMTHSSLSRACVDIDGVLCADPTAEENDDGERYREFLATARPLSLPTREVAHLVTSRLEKYRGPTEQWLADHGVGYGQLHMLDLPDAATRQAKNAHASFKAEIYRQSEAIIFIESDPWQAREIARLAKKPVTCFSEQTLYSGESAGRSGRRIATLAARRVRRRARSTQAKISSMRP